MKKKLLAVLMTGIMAMSFAATTTAVYAKGDDEIGRASCRERV